jgi:hypothetical protein
LWRRARLVWALAGKVICRDRRFTRVHKAAAVDELERRMSLPRTQDKEIRRSVSRRELPFLRKF